jgi:hypothetical protein
LRILSSHWRPHCSGRDWVTVPCSHDQQDYTGDNVFEFLNEPWVQLLIGGLIQAVIVVLTWRWNENLGKLLGIMVLAVFPIALLVVQNFDVQAKQLDHVMQRVVSVEQTNKIGSLLETIGNTRPRLRTKADSLYTATVTTLEQLAKGREQFVARDAQQEYLDVLREEVECARPGSIIWDFVMPIKPERIKKAPDGYPPVRALLDAVEEAVKKRRVTYNLVVQAPEGVSDAELAAALDSIAARSPEARPGVGQIHLYTVARDDAKPEKRFPTSLRKNFMLLEDDSVVCIAERLDDAQIVGGQRIRGDAQTLKEWKAVRKNIFVYAKEWGHPKAPSVASGR